MRQPKPKLPSTRVHSRTGEWLPATFDEFLVELDGLSAQATAQRSLLLYRGHRDRRWRLDSTFVREVKQRLLKMEPTDGFAPRLHNSFDLNATLTGLLLLKFGSLVGPSPELLQISDEHGVDPLFELMKRYQQYPAEDMPQLPGTNLLDWSRSKDVAVYFANEQRSGEGAIFVCDATATGKTLQVIPVAEILSKLRDRMRAGMPHGAPLLFSPKRQIGYVRAKNQQAIYFAQMDLRIDLLEQWRLQEHAQPDSTVLVKIILPEGSVSDCQAYLADKGINAQYIYPANNEIP